MLDFLFLGGSCDMESGSISINFTFNHHLQLCYKKIG